jgi:hypothetical protein
MAVPMPGLGLDNHVNSSAIFGSVAGPSFGNSFRQEAPDAAQGSQAEIEPSQPSVYGVTPQPPELHTLRPLTPDGRISTIEGIFQSPRPPTQDRDNENNLIPARDFGGHNTSRAELYGISPILGDLANMYNESGVVDGKQRVENMMKQLAVIFTMLDWSMRPVAQDMFEHFINGNGADYRNNLLTERVIAHQSTQRYLDETQKKIIEQLAANGGDLAALQSAEFEIEMNRINLPQFSTSGDMFTGLMICVNDIWGARIEISDYRFDGESFSGTLRYTLYDHFALDKEDLTSTRRFMGVPIQLRYFNQFGAWYVLQYYEGTNGQYKPFVTYIETEIPFSGSVR